MKKYNKNKESSYLHYWDVNNSYGWEMSQTLPVNDFKLVEDISKFHESFLKSYNEESDEVCIFEVDLQYPDNLYNFHIDLPFLSESMKIENVESLNLIYVIKLNILFT